MDLSEAPLGELSEHSRATNHREYPVICCVCVCARARASGGGVASHGKHLYLADPSAENVGRTANADDAGWLAGLLVLRLGIARRVLSRWVRLGITLGRRFTSKNNMRWVVVVVVRRVRVSEYVVRAFTHTFTHTHSHTCAECVAAECCC